MMEFDKEMGVEEYASSVGAAFRDKQIYSLQHPAYVNFSNDVTEELTKIAERASVQRSTARKLVITTYLDADEAAALQDLYPEFTPVYVVMNRHVHSYWVANRVAANEWCAVSTERWASSYVHYGGSLFSTLMRQSKGAHLESDPSDAVMVHQKHSDAVDAHRVFGDYAAVQASYGVVVPRKSYDDYLKNTAYDSCTKAGVCTKQVDAMCIDLSTSALSTVQVALSMLQHGAELCHGFFIYHPSMLVLSEGELPGTGVRFERCDKEIKFLYPDGRAGVESYSRTMYAGWLASHSFCVGGDKTWFQLELLKNRGPFMFFRMVKVDCQIEGGVFRHALDLPSDDEYTLVKSWKMKDGFRSSVEAGRDLIPHSFLARSRIVRRVFEFAMQLTPTNFSRFAVKKYIRVVNNRWVVNGSTVAVSAPLTPGEVEDLTTAIFSRAFVARYESSQLTKDMMEQLKRISAFNDASFLQRVEAIASAVMGMVLTETLGRVDKWFRNLCDGIATYFGAKPGDKPVEVVKAPTYVTLESIVGSWRSLFAKHGEVLYSSGLAGMSCPVVETAAGGSLAAIFSRYSLPNSGSGWDQSDLSPDLDAVVRLVTDVEDTRTATVSAEGFIEAVRALNEVDAVAESRHELEFTRAVREAGEVVQDFKRGDCPDPVSDLNQLYLECLPAVANQRIEFDTFSLSLDPQDRTLSAPMLRMSNYFGPPPMPRGYFASRLKALNVPKRQNTAPELLTAINARNLSAPVVSLPQEEDVMIEAIWENFLDQCCVPNAREKLLRYQSDPVALGNDALSDWASKAKPGVVDKIVAELEKNSQSMADMPVEDYLVMLKADVKPTLSTKPVNEVTAPQVIVYHDKPLSALYSSIFRVLVRRFLSLLKPNFHVNLLKDTKDIAEFLTSVHPFGAKGLRYLENDFSKYDKSQSQFVFRLEEFVFKHLGMNLEMLDKWVGGHVECSLRSVSVGLSLHVMYQRKSGDATTAFGNVMLNVLSVMWAYRGTKVVWAVFMGDDSIVCANGTVVDDVAVQTLAEVFNLSAKFYVTDAPYFSSNFVLIDDGRLTIKMCPDVVKRIERLSMPIAADEPQWRERYTSYCDAMQVFTDEAIVQQMAKVVPQRYEVSEGLVRGAVSALGALAKDYGQFRGLWEDAVTVIEG